MLTILFQILLAALVLLSFVMVIGVPVGYAVPQGWDRSKQLILFGSIVWGALVIVVGVLNYLVA
ncbi:MAG: photosystem II reaction center protein PsbZ [Leptolyngbyaceae bacterium]|nr:photosystem II reaction center protein PsbZ [Leptolyngbyaceae bacterium]